MDQFEQAIEKVEVEVEINGEVKTIEVGERVWVGHIGFNNVRWGFFLERRDDLCTGPDNLWGCDVFFINPDLPAHDFRSFVCAEESRCNPATWADTPQGAVDIALGDVEGLDRVLCTENITLTGTMGVEVTLETYADY